MERKTGRFRRSTVSGETVDAFVPGALPPADPSLALDGDLAQVLARAEHAVSRLELAGEMVPSLDWFIYAFVRKEAVLSSQIEGTQATLVDLLTFEADGAEGTEPERGRRGGLQLPRRAHLRARPARRAEGAAALDAPPQRDAPAADARRARRREAARRGATQPELDRRERDRATPRTCRRRRTRSARCSARSRSTCTRSDTLPPLVRAGLLHVQFETIHPYLDGNGRIGRLLVTLLLEHWELLHEAAPLPEPLLQAASRRVLPAAQRRAHRSGDWEGWTEFFLQGVGEIAEESANTARDLYRLVAKDRVRVVDARNSSLTAVRLLELLPRHPVVTIPGSIRMLATTKPTATKAVGLLESLGILKETTGRKRDRAYKYAPYLDLLRTGTELIPARRNRP